MRLEDAQPQGLSGQGESGSRAVSFSVTHFVACLTHHGLDTQGWVTALTCPFSSVEAPP